MLSLNRPILLHERGVFGVRHWRELNQKEHYVIDVDFSLNQSVDLYILCVLMGGYREE